MKFERYEIPENRSEFEHGFNVLHNTIKSGKFHVAEGISMDGILRVRKLPNGRLDFLSVNESARLHANTILHMQNFNFPDDIKDSGFSNTDKD
ncbi:hypothetical protein JQC92_12040 [Shewanella sp. 202IG2-18]|uniref:AVAST type 1 anti-phage system protein Avs1c n=1 Tax=Parashewanella hymeniacidonis TaxID=2807618 RepID=UPI0019619773|nr:AVAST type 1 anti-phage system protein Avs1c [Parashewanella hymeniacidonis]MBM7072754.1 hypothetical protein [Parashewanella hymeniacidonis]